MTGAGAAADTDTGGLAPFLELSAVLTGHTRFALRATGQAEAYLTTVTDAVGASTVAALFDAFSAVQQAPGEELGGALRRQILSDPLLGPVARNLIKLWYVGIWYALPRAWHDAQGRAVTDQTFVVSPQAYTEGLLWPTVGANPSGAKPFGYAMWAQPPRIDAAGRPREDMP